MTTASDRERLRMQLMRHEGVRMRPYRDSMGYLTIGIGRNLDTVGLSAVECQYLLDNDIDKAIVALTAYPWFTEIDSVRQAALINMMFNLGPDTFAEFTHLIASLAKGDYGSAAVEMLQSEWAEQVGRRAHELSEQMRSGVWQV